MKQRALVLLAEYLAKRPKGRIVRVLPFRHDDYVVAIEDARDGRTHVVRTPRDLDHWLRSFAAGRCEPAAFGICGVCDRVHSDRDADGEILRHCMRCAAELIEVAAERYWEVGR